MQHRAISVQLIRWTALVALCLFVCAIAIGCGTSKSGGGGSVEEDAGGCQCPQPSPDSQVLACELETEYGEACIDFIGEGWTWETAAEVCSNYSTQSKYCNSNIRMFEGFCDQTGYIDLCRVEEKYGESWQYYYGLHREVCEEEFGGEYWSRCDTGPAPNATLKIIFEYHKLPNARIQTDFTYSGNSDLSGSIVHLAAFPLDTEAEPATGYEWSTDCEHADIVGDIAADKIDLLPNGTEVCKVFLKVFSNDPEINGVVVFVRLDIACTEFYRPVDGGPDQPMNDCRLNNGCVPATDACEGLVCGMVRNDCGLLQFCGMCAENEICSPDKTACVPDGCDPEPPETTCGTRVCGDVTNNCGSSVNCGTCDAGFDCNDGTCEELPVIYSIWTSSAFNPISTSALACADLLSADGWTLEEATTMMNEINTGSGTAYVDVVTEPTSCKETLGQSLGCIALNQATGVPAPHRFFWINDDFPEPICRNSSNGTPIYAPFLPYAEY